MRRKKSGEGKKIGGKNIKRMAAGRKAKKSRAEK
jgi:hypothetical protein